MTTARITNLSFKFPISAMTIALQMHYRGYSQELKVSSQVRVKSLRNLIHILRQDSPFHNKKLGSNAMTTW